MRVGKFWKWVGIAMLGGLAVLLAVVLLLPVKGRVSVKGVATINLSHAKQLWLAAYYYAGEHDGRFPIHLAELEPDYLPPESLENLLYRSKVDKEQPTRFRYEWLYFGAFFDEKNPPSLFIASPEAFNSDHKSKRILIRSDGTGQLVENDEYQEELRKTIEAMRQRRDAVKNNAE